MEQKVIEAMDIILEEFLKMSPEERRKKMDEHTPGWVYFIYEAEKLKYNESSEEV